MKQTQLVTGSTDAFALFVARLRKQLSNARVSDMMLEHALQPLHQHLAILRIDLHRAPAHRLVRFGAVEQVR
jgi:hypothetical protein